MHLRNTGHLILLLALLLPGAAAWAQWELDSDRSAVNFVSIKNNSVAEVHSFSSLAGFIGSEGVVQLAIDLDSVETLIPVRNERMRELLFETAMFPAANISAKLTPDQLSAIAGAGVQSVDLPVVIALHGVEKALNISVAATRGTGGSLRVLSTRPLVLNAADFGLEGGVLALQKIAGLIAISNAVPVTLNLLFVPAP